MFTPQKGEQFFEPNFILVYMISKYPKLTLIFFYNTNDFTLFAYDLITSCNDSHLPYIA